MKSNKNTGSFSGKGYYIALILCAAAIGISGYLYYRNANTDDPQLQDPTSDVGVVNPADDDISVVGPTPTQPDSTKGTEPDPTTPTQKKPMKTGMPVSGKTIHEYAMDCLSYNETTRDWRVHNGIDIAAEAGTTVCAAADGTVYTTYDDETMGMTVVIRHDNGYVTVYSSLADTLLVEPGDTVTLGQAIGTVGNSALLESALGDHIHFSVTCNGESVNPADFFALG